jgi:hypothetical protein
MIKEGIMKKRNWGKTLLILATVGTLALTGCGSSKSSSGDSAAGAEVAYETASSADYGLYDNKSVAEESVVDNAAETVVDTSRKLITTVNLNAETEDLDDTLSKVESKIRELGGYVEYSNINNGSSYSSKISRSADMTVRIPQEKLDDFVTSVEGNTNITYKSTSVDDVTLTYVDIDSRKKALKTEESRLLEILNSAETVEDIITVESRLSEVRYEIESIESQLRSYDNLVSYSTVNLNISEVQKFTPVEKEGAFARMGKGFMESLDAVGNGIVEFFVWLVSHLPQIILLVVVIVVIIVIVKKVSTKNARKRAEKMAAMQKAYQNAMPPYNNGPVQAQNVSQDKGKNE